VAVHVGLLLWDQLPLLQVGLGLLSHGIYAALLRDFPYIEFWNPWFLASIVAVVANHSLWFLYFTNNYGMQFGEVTAIFFFCVWLVPFIYFISVTANEQTLPYGMISSCK
jgi:hypothetical protein